MLTISRCKPYNQLGMESATNTAFQIRANDARLEN